RNGSEAQASSGPGGTTSVWPSSTSTGPPVPCVAQRLSTAPKRSRSQAKPAAAKRVATSAWQPASSGVTERRAMRSWASASTPGTSTTHAEALLEAVVAEALGHHAIVGDDHGAPHQRRMLAQQQVPLRVGAGRLAVGRQVAPGRGRLVDHRVPAAECVAPRLERLRRRLVLPVVDEVVRDAEAVQPLARLAAGVAVGQAVERRRHSASPRSRSLIEVFERVRASTRLTITAQYSECEPSAAGSCPDTTTLYGGTYP